MTHVYQLGRWLEYLARKGVIFAHALLVLLAVAILAMVFETREPPLKVLPHGPFAVKAGEWAEIRIPVRRDLSRRCSARYSRTLIDADGSRFDLPGGAETAEGIRAIDQRTPNELRVMVLIPPIRTSDRAGIDPGTAVLKHTRSWACNPYQEIVPIRASTETRLYVHP